MIRSWWLPLLLLAFVWMVPQSSEAGYSQERKKLGIRFCPSPKVNKTSPLGFKRALRKALKGLASRRYTNQLADAYVRLWRMTKGGGKGGPTRRFRRTVRKTIKKLKKEANKPFCFAHPKRLLFYGIKQLKNRPMAKVEKYCLDHDTYKVFTFVPGSFLTEYPRSKPCEGVMYTELRRKIGFSELYYPVMTTFRLTTFDVGGQRVDVYTWKDASQAMAKKAGNQPSFRYRLLLLRKKLPDTKANRANMKQLLAANKALLDKELKLMRKKMKDLKFVMGGYILMHAHKGQPAFFGHLQYANLKGFLQKLLDTPLGRWILTNAVSSNLDHVTRP